MNEKYSSYEHISPNGSQTGEKSSGHIGSSDHTLVNPTRHRDFLEKYPPRNYKVELALFITLTIGALLKPQPDITQSHITDPLLTTPKLTDTPSMYIDQTYNPSSTRKALEHEVSLINPDGSIRNERNGQVVRPMDVAIDALALAKIKDSYNGEDNFYLNHAERATDWLVTHVTKSTDPESERYANLHIDDGSGEWARVPLDGSFWSEYDTNGMHWPSTKSRRARGEENGEAITAIMAVEMAKPGYIFKDLSDPQGNSLQVIDGIEGMANLLMSPLLLDPDGRFYHSPEFHKHFGEEQARDREGLYAAATAYDKAASVYPEKAEYYKKKAEQARSTADRNFLAVRQYGTDVGQALDPQGIALWGQSDPGAPDSEVSQTALAQEGIHDMENLGLVSSSGIGNYDMQQNTNSDQGERMKYFLYGHLTRGYAQLIDFGQANVSAKDIPRAEAIADLVAGNQGEDGGIPQGRTAFLNIPYGEAEGYNDARLILLNARLGQAKGQINARVKTPNKIQQFLGNIKGWTWGKVWAHRPEKNE